jgi:hypothetical protein
MHNPLMPQLTLWILHTKTFQYYRCPSVLLTHCRGTPDPGHKLQGMKMAAFHVVVPRMNHRSGRIFAETTKGFSENLSS